MFIRSIAYFISYYIKYIMLVSYPASLRNVGGSTQVPVCARKYARKGIWAFPPPVKLERRHITYNMSAWRKTQLNK
jgi:hypothetical protein